MDEDEELIPQHELEGVRKELGLNLSELSRHMKDAGIIIGPQAIAGWEQGKCASDPVVYYRFTREMARLRKEGVSARQGREIEHEETGRVATSLRALQAMVSEYIRAKARDASPQDLQQLAADFDTAHRQFKAHAQLLAGLAHDKESRIRTRNRNRA